MKKAIVLLSGGLDSAVTLFCAREKKYNIICLSFNYNQRHKKEIESAKKIAKLVKAKHIILDIELPSKSSSLIDRDIPIVDRSLIDLEQTEIPTTYVPARNIIFLSYALSYAETESADVIFIGANAVDYSGYPDCRPEFIETFKKISEVGTKKGIEGNPINIKTPLIEKSKAEIVKLGSKLGVPFEYTWSCYRGKATPCGSCDSCKLREKGFREANIRDPLMKK